MHLFNDILPSLLLLLRSYGFVKSEDIEVFLTL